MDDRRPVTSWLLLQDYQHLPDSFNFIVAETAPVSPSVSLPQNHLCIIDTNNLRKATSSRFLWLILVQQKQKCVFSCLIAIKIQHEPDSTVCYITQRT